MRFGKHPAVNDYRTLRLARYLTPELPPPPPAYDVLQRIARDPGDDVATLFPMDGNDRYGDCTIAGLAHAVTCWRGMIGQRVIPDAGEVVRVYFQLSGGIDSGLNELAVLNHFRKHAIRGEKILAFARLDPKNHDHVKQAIKLFGGVYIGFQVQEDCMADFSAGRTWTTGNLLNEGHAVYATSYDEGVVRVLTWGALQAGTWAWWDQCVDEAWAIIGPEAKDATYAPGFDFATLKADLAAVGSPV
jgi:hypothetical protein